VKDRLPGVTVQRLPLYLKCLDDLPAGQAQISSEELANQVGLNAAMVRKDLSYLGSCGVRGVGYNVEHLRFHIKQALGLNNTWPIVIVGIGNLGRALANFDRFSSEGFHAVGLFDNDPEKVGDRVDGLAIEHINELAAAVADRSAVIGVIATPAHAAQEVADLLAGSGVRSILNFAPTVIKVPAGVKVRQADFSTEMQVLAFYLHQQS
jgi:redox-sensing transcriptional repressor